MNGQQYKKLQPYEHQFKTAIECNYARNLTNNTLLTMAKVYEDIFETKSKLGNGCGGCQLKDLKLLGKAYFEYKDKHNEIMQKARDSKKNKEITEDNNGNQEDGKESE